MHILTVVGARPNFVKLAGLHLAFEKYPDIKHTIVHTGQHYDFGMNEQFFQEFKLPVPDHHLGIGSGSHAEQVGKTMIALEPIFLKEKPDWILVVGDVNATIASAIVAKKSGLRIAHVEAGLRSGDWGMPEEINRILTDRVSDLLLVSDPAGLDNLKVENAPDERIHFVGNIMIDTLHACLPLTESRNIFNDFGVTPGEYALLTLHRPSNVDDPKKLQNWMDGVENIAEILPVVFPVHPRTRSRLTKIGYEPKTENLKAGEQLGYLDNLALMKNARVVMTDSGGIQEETTILGVPCLTLRDNTERPITVSCGTNRLIGSKPECLVSEVMSTLEGEAGGEKKIPENWDGKTGIRIAEILLKNSALPLRGE